MAVPDELDFTLPILKIAGDGKIHSNQEVYEKLAQEFGLTEADFMERNNSNTDFKFPHRIRFARSYLQKACLLSSAGRGKFRITERGMNTLKDNPTYIDHKYLGRFPEYVKRNKRKINAS